MSHSTEEKSYVGMSQCFFCLETKELLLDRRLRNSLPKRACYNQEPCETCKGHMKQGVILISTRDGESGNNPYRTGGWVVVREEAIERMVSDTALRTHILKVRVAFLPDAVWDKLGLPRATPTPS